MRMHSTISVPMPTICMRRLHAAAIPLHHLTAPVILKESRSLREAVAMSDLTAKRDRLLAILREMPRAVVAFSGGIDSTIVAQAAFFALGDRAVAVTSDSASVPRAELALAIELAKRI